MDTFWLKTNETAFMVFESMEALDQKCWGIDNRLPHYSAL